MKAFSLEHILMLICTIVVYIILGFIVKKSNKKIQNIIFIVLAIGCSFGIFFRYAMNLKWTLNFDWYSLFTQLLQVCNFNFILLPLMLIPKNELARQYSMMFSMYAAFTSFTSISSSWSKYNWYDLVVLNSWLNHSFAIALPLMMIISRRYKPQKKYVLPVFICIFAYFTSSFIIQEILKYNGMSIGDGWSFIYDPMGAPLLKQLYDLIKIPYVYLLPMAPLIYLFELLQVKLFQNYKLLERKSIK